MTQAFDRVRTRVPDAQGVPGTRRPAGDVEGKAVLFSRADAAPTLGSAVITCSSCRNATLVTYLRALQLAVPSLHLPLIRREFPSWMRCPDCERRTWVRVRLR